MTDQAIFHYQLECSPTSATVYLGGAACSPRIVDSLATIVADLPRSTRMLRVDLHGIVSMRLQTLMDLRAVMARWRTERNANVRLVLRSPLPREASPSSDIHFEPARLQLVRTSRTDELAAVLSHRVRDVSAGRRGAVRPQSALHLCLMSSGAL